MPEACNRSWRRSRARLGGGCVRAGPYAEHVAVAHVRRSHEQHHLATRPPVSMWPPRSRQRAARGYGKYFNLKVFLPSRCAPSALWIRARCSCFGGGGRPRDRRGHLRHRLGVSALGCVALCVADADSAGRYTLMVRTAGVLRRRPSDLDLQCPAFVLAGTSVRLCKPLRGDPVEVVEVRGRACLRNGADVRSRRRLR